MKCKVIVLIITLLLAGVTPAFSQDPTMAMSSKSIWLKNGNSKFLGPNKDDYATMSNVAHGYVFVGDGSALQNGKSYNIQTGGKFLYNSAEDWARFDSSASNKTFSWIIEKQKHKCPPSSQDDFIRHGDVILLRNAYYPKSYLYDNEGGKMFAAAGNYPNKPREWIVDWKLTEVPRTQMAANNEIKSPVTSDNFDVIVISGKNNFTKIWDDKGTGAEKDVSIWRPLVPSGYFSLGDVVLSNHMADDRDKKLYTLAIRPKQGKEHLLAKPIGVTELWNDAGTGAEKDIRINKLNCPPGFNALGVIGNNLPDECRCVADSETAKGSWGSTTQNEPLSAYWTDKGSGASKDVSFWRVSAGMVNGKNQLALSPNTFYSSDRHATVPVDTPYALKLTFSNVKIFDEKDVDEPNAPKFMPNGELPPSFASTTKEYYIPFFLVPSDNSYASQIEQMEKSPEYKVTRTSTYVINTQSTLSSNKATLASQLMKGKSTTKDKNFSAGVTAGLSVMAGGKAGVPLVAEGSVEITASIETSFSYSWGGSEGTYDEKTDSYTIEIGPDCKGVIFQRVDNYVIKNSKEEEVHSYSSNIPIFGQDIWCKGYNTTAVTNPGATVGKENMLILNPGTEMKVGQKYWSENGQFYAIFQPDGNFRVSTKDDGYKWDIVTAGKLGPGKVGPPLFAKKLVLRTDGNLVFFGPNDTYHWSIDKIFSPAANSTLNLSNSGDILMIAPNGAVLWSSRQ